MGLKDFMEPFFKKNAGNGTAVMEQEHMAEAKPKYRRISPKEAKAMMDADQPVTILDVREPYEFKSGYIENAVLLPSGVVPVKAAEVLPDKNATILVYCLSGARSAGAARSLVRMGYTNVYDFGGISGWPYAVVTK